MSELASLGSAIVSLYFGERGARQAQTGLSQLMSCLGRMACLQAFRLEHVAAGACRGIVPQLRWLDPCVAKAARRRPAEQCGRAGWFETCRVGQLTEMKRQTAAPIHCTSFCTIKNVLTSNCMVGIANWSLPLPCHPLRMSPCCSCRINLALT